MTFWGKEKSLAQSEPYELHKFYVVEEEPEDSTHTIRYVDPDATGAGNGTSWADAYTSLNYWNTNEGVLGNKNLVSLGQIHTVYCRSSNGTPDTTASLINGWTTDSNYYVEIIGYDFPEDGIWDDTKYVLHNNDDGLYAMNITSDNIHVINLQIKVTSIASSAQSRDGIFFVGTQGTIIDSCIIKGICGGTGTAAGIHSNDSSTTVSIYNTLIYDFKSGADNDFYGLICHCDTINIYNSTVYGCYNGIYRVLAGTMNVYNTISANNTDNFKGTIATIDHCCSDAGEGTNPQSPYGGNWNNEFNNIAGEDFNLKSGGNCVGNGIDTPASETYYTDDIRGKLRNTNWDIGAFEYGSYSESYVPYEHLLPPYNLLAWYFADAPYDIQYNGDTYIACYITGEKIEEGSTIIKSRTKVKTNWNNSFAWQYTTVIPGVPIHYKRFRGQGSDVKLIFQGNVLSVEFKQTSRQGDRYAEIVIEPLRAQLGELGLISRYSRQCTVELYSDQCGANRALYVKQGTLDSYSGNVLTSTTFGTESDGYWEGGYIIINGYYAKIIDHSGDNITILPFIYNLSAGNEFFVFPGCNHLYDEDCVNRFSNQANCKCQPFIPYINSFSEGAMFD